MSKNQDIQHADTQPMPGFVLLFVDRLSATMPNGSTYASNGGGIGGTDGSGRA
ncbi:TPA: hypothetical protein QDC20_003186 [Burkholderia aenigmatica]|uniref:hypothetical protein n=1 Tax=Burkholderia sp. AU45251 TaxID=3059204 RepID=UPI002650EDAE|nr:hypothetical protein [Burkholderia sp. AU45251]HDR9481645.1 hypothetical protein [Burkholderia aenigmatica]MDN7513732.1 hypothetical protein [Burkholderia sp. AU45251]HDR9513172.1 hypothetical protein [Burkholderia aenigmatica]HDR9590016.1 hypothetical protein [Burkholderia aenigmatica]HDR9597979.1 hypothetical protein [Burkholderia aenigmatica]